MTDSRHRRSVDGESDPGRRSARALESATVGLGCFWGPDARFGALTGVIRTRVGYAGGTTPNPTYHDLGDHTEVLQIDFDPDQVSYEELLEQAWAAHDWRASAHKRQYRGVILTHGEGQGKTARRSRDALAERTGQSVSTAIEPLESFTMAEPYHQKYELRSTPIAGDELVDRYGDGFVDATVTARLNGVVAGYELEEDLERVLEAADCSPMACKEIRRRVEGI